jgi:hypothetical protein
MSTPRCWSETLDPGDIPSVISTNSKPLSRTLVHVRALGLGYEPFMRWSTQDIEAAACATNADQRMRFTVSALMNARRALSCLADQYLFRDGFVFCRDAPREANEKAKLLVRRGVFDDLASRALRRAVDRRNTIEHEYDQVSFFDAQDGVQLIRATMETCVNKSDPCLAPALFGSFLGRCSSSGGKETHSFDAWAGLLFILARCDSPPWFGVVVPSSEVEATLRRVHLSELSCDQLLELLLALEKQSSPGYSAYGERTFEAQLACLLGR